MSYHNFNIEEGIPETPSSQRSMGDDTLSSREGDDRTLPSGKSRPVSSDVPSMHEQLDRDGTDSGEGIQRILDERGDGGADRGFQTTSKTRRDKSALSDRGESNPSDRTRDSTDEGTNGNEQQTGGRGGSNGYTLSESLHIPVKDFGTNYPEYYHDSKGAIEKLLKEKHGQVQGAFYKEGLGNIDLVWGEVTNAEKHTGYGLAHILDKHPEIVDRIPEIMNKGVFSKDEKNRLKIQLGNEIIGIKDNWKGKKTNHWIVTSYEKEGDKSLYTSSSPLKREEILSHSSLGDFTTEKSKNPKKISLQSLTDKKNQIQQDLQKLETDFDESTYDNALKTYGIVEDTRLPHPDLLPSNQEISNEIKEAALEVANNANPTQDTQPYRPLVESVEKRVLQNKAEAKKEVVFNDLEDIKKDLPYLLKEQAEDVKFAEERFATGKRGVLFTNGTGTGKTFTGLGIAKRKLKMGAKNILILTQSTQKNLDWKKEGKILNIDMVEVKDT